MTLDFVSASYHAPDASLLKRLGLSHDTDPHQSLRALVQPGRSQGGAQSV